MSFLIQDVTDGKLVKIAEDALDVADRIREIDEGYEIYYNRAKNRFEIYKKGEPKMNMGRRTSGGSAV